jgi:geranylgeranyl reductase family protein
VTQATCDVLIVGGGPAGSSCARPLVRAGMDVIVMDRKAFPRDKLCAGWITPQVLDTLELEVAQYASTGRVIQPLLGFQVSRAGDREARVVYDHVVSYGIRRCEFDHYLLERSGARLRLGEPLQTLERERGGWKANGNLRAEVVVGAGGHFCPVARRLGAELGQSEPVIAAQEIEFEMSPHQRAACRIDGEVPEIYFERDLKGYGWVFRKGDFLNVGLGRQGNAGLGDHVARFLGFLAERGKLPPEFSEKLRGHPYLLYDEAPRSLVGDGALLVGDAAGLAYPRSGEGIRPAIESGMLAAETIVDACGEYGIERLAPYERRIVERFGPRRRQRALTDLLPDSMLQGLAGRLFATDWFARRVVLNDWFFHADQPSLQPAATAASSRPRVDAAAAR